MSMIEPEGNANRNLTKEDFTKDGEIKTKSGDLALVVQSASVAETFIANKQWALLWRDSDLLFQNPRPMTVYEGTYVLEPNVQRFTVAKICNAVVPQLYKGLFYADPPMILRPRPGTSQDITTAKTAMFSYLLDACKFRRDTKWGLEQMAQLGTSIWKWGICYEKVEIVTRKATTTTIKSGPSGVAGSNVSVPLDDEPDITTTVKFVPRPFFEYRPIARVLVDPHLLVGDIREADHVIDVRYMDFYQMKELKETNSDEKGRSLEGWSFPTSLINLWLPPEDNVAPKLATDQQA